MFEEDCSGFSHILESNRVSYVLGFICVSIRHIVRAEVHGWEKRWVVCHLAGERLYRVRKGRELDGDDMLDPC